MIALSMKCKIVGHSFRDTFVITEDGYFFEVDDARYCQHCGTVHTKLQSN